MGCRTHEGTPSIIFSFHSFFFLRGYFPLSSFLLVCELSSFIYLSSLFPSHPNSPFPFSIRSSHSHTFSFSALKECEAFPLPPLSLCLSSLLFFLQKISILPHVSYLFLLPSFFVFCLLIRNLRKRKLSASITSVQQTEKVNTLCSLLTCHFSFRL